MSMSYMPFSLTEELIRRQSWAQQEIDQGYPVVAMTYRNGIVFVTRSTPVMDKIYSLLPGMACAAVGRYHHIDELVDRIKETSRVTGFHNGQQRPLLEIVRDRDGIRRIIGDRYEGFMAPYAIDIALAETGCSEGSRQDRFYRVDFIGGLDWGQDFIVCGGSARENVEQYVRKANPAFRSLGLEEAVELSVNALRSSQQDHEFLDSAGRFVLHMGILEHEKDLRYPSGQELERFHNIASGDFLAIR